MSLHDNEAPEWYLSHFWSRGYTTEDLNDIWAGLSEGARNNYRKFLCPDPMEADR